MAISWLPKEARAVFENAPLHCLAAGERAILARLRAERVTREVSCPTIGIGAGSGCDGQVLVVHDMLGMNKGFKPKFLRHYADLHTVMTEAVSHYVADVRSGEYPNADEQW